jgi:hypothetical protein
LFWRRTGWIWTVQSSPPSLCSRQAATSTGLPIGCARTPVQGEHLRADHLVENVLQSRLARGVNGQSKNSPKLDEATASEYHNILAKAAPLSSSGNLFSPFPLWTATADSDAVYSADRQLR